MIEWDIVIMVVAAYLLGAFLMKIGMEKAGHTPPWTSKYWWDCDDCRDELPGVVSKIGANTEQHLDQMIGWHYDDMHKED